eukprot:tig00021127_g18762.t1
MSTCAETIDILNIRRTILNKALCSEFDRRPPHGWDAIWVSLGLQNAICIGGVYPWGHKIGDERSAGRCGAPATGARDAAFRSELQQQQP